MQEISLSSSIGLSADTNSSTKECILMTYSMIGRSPFLIVVKAILELTERVLIKEVQFPSPAF